MIQGFPKFDGLAVMEVAFSYLTQGVTLRAKAAFVQSKTGMTHGYTDVTSGWSKDTLEKLEELRACLERDLGNLHFGDAVSAAPRSPASASTPQGIGEYFADVGVSQF